MKKLLKLSLLVGIFMLILTIKSYAEGNHSITYGELQSNGDMDVTVTYTAEIEESARQSLIDAGFTIAEDNKTITKTFTGVNERPTFLYLQYDCVCIATPFTMKVGDQLQNIQTLTSISSSDSTIVEKDYAGNFTAKKVGQATLTFVGSHNGEQYELTVNVINDTGSGTSTGDIGDVTPTPAGATDFSGLKLSFRDTDRFDHVIADYSGITKLQGHTYTFYVSTDANGSADYDSSKLVTFTKDSDGKEILFFTGEKARLLSEYKVDKYLHIIDTYYEGSDKKTSITDKKITETVNTNRPIGSRFDVYLFAKDKSCIINGIEASKNRKVTYSVGAVNSTEILKAFKENTPTGFSKLLAFAKENNSPLKKDSFDLPATNDNTLNYNLMDSINLTNGAYYYVYYTISTNDGTYVETEDVQIYKALSDGTAVHFAYGSIDIPDEPVNPDENNNPSDEEKPPVFPDTGEKTLIFSIIGVTSIVAIVLFRKNKITKIK